MKKLATLLAVSALAVGSMAFASSAHTGHHHHAPTTTKAPAKTAKPTTAPTAPVSKSTGPTAQ